MSNDPLAVLDAPKVEVEEPLPFTDEDDARHIKLMSDVNERLSDAFTDLGAAAKSAGEKFARLHLVRCDSCEQLYRRDSKGLQEAYGYQGLRHKTADEGFGSRLPLFVICGDCVNDINRRSDLATQPHAPYPLPSTLDIDQWLTVPSTVGIHNAWNTNSTVPSLSNVVISYPTTTTGASFT